MRYLVLWCQLISISALAQDFEVLFTRQINNNDNLYAVHATTGVLRQITDHPRKDSGPVMSPDGQSLVFASERVGWWKIWRLDLETNQFRQLTDLSSPEYNPVWTADGKQIIFVSGRTNPQQIFSMDPNGQKVRQLTDGSDHVMPSCGSDARIYYSQLVNKHYQIGRMKADGTLQQILTTSPDDKFMPQLSGDGQLLLYYGNRDGNFEIYKSNVDGSDVVRLTNHPLQDIRAHWSQDDRWIVFERGNKKNNEHIFIMKSDGTGLRQLTTSGYNYAPSIATKQ